MGTTNKQIRVLVTGGQGQLGRALARHYATGAGTVAAPGRAELDVTDPASARAALDRVSPTLIIHAAAATDVDRCEREPAWAIALNAEGTWHLAALAGERDIPFVYVSTNYVFDGSKPAGEAYAESDPTGPLSVYGRTKLAGEEATRQLAPRHQIVRTAQVYAAQGRKFVQTMLGLADAGKTTIGGVADQWGQPTYAVDLAAGIATLAATEAWGTYHLTNAGACTWADWATEIFRLSDRAVTVEPIPAATFKRDATPPTNGVLQNRAAAALGVALPDWRDGLRRCLAEMGELRVV
ncbi:MAG TPA: dTDP-4-dehydrorhamnose reductase [Thermomicrobiales bacterium]|jgi:dTDP-4-dehydrorhamnose reductase